MDVQKAKEKIKGISSVGIRMWGPVLKGVLAEHAQEILEFVKCLRDTEFKENGDCLQTETYRLLAGAIEIGMGNDWPDGLSSEEKEVSKDIANLWAC